MAINLNMDATLDKIVKQWVADREGVSVLDVTDLEYDFDEGWPGTEVTPGELPEIVIKYTIKKTQVYRHPANKLGDFIFELAKVARRGPL
jgi:hypothetical protein